MVQSIGREWKLLQLTLLQMAMTASWSMEQQEKPQQLNPQKKKRSFESLEAQWDLRLKFYLVLAIMKLNTRSIKPSALKKQAHFRAVADATDLPMMMYDIPGRTGVPIEPDTIVRLAEHPRIVALKDAKGDVASTSWVIKRCGIPVYSGDDILNLPLLSVGAVGFVSVCGHTVGKDLRELLDSWFAGNAARALEIHQKLLPVYTGTFRTQGAILTKAALTLMGLPGGHTRLPLVDATDAQIAQLREDLRAGGVAVN